MTSQSSNLCLQVSWTTEQDEFTVNSGWIAGAFFLGLAAGCGIAFLIITLCMKDCAKKKRQDEEESMLKKLENENTVVATATTTTTKQTDTDKLIQPAPKSKGEKFKSFFKRKSGKNLETDKKDTGWVGTDGDNKQNDANVGLVTILTNDNRANAESELTKQDMRDVDKLDQEQKQAKEDMRLKMLKIKLRKMKGKNGLKDLYLADFTQKILDNHHFMMRLKMLKIKLRKMKGKNGLKDPYLADFTQKILDNRRSAQEVLDTEKQEMEDELRRKHGKNKAALESELENLNVKMNAKKRHLDEEELELMRSELLRTSGLSESEVDDVMDRLKQELAELERKQGIEQARQARHLAERLEKRRQLLEFRKLQEQQSRDKLAGQVAGFEEPLNKLIDEEKLTDKQKKEILDEHARNLQNLQREHELNAMRQQSELAEKLQKRRDTRLKKLQEKHDKEKKTYLDRGDKSNNTEDYMNTYHKLLQQQHVESEQVQSELDQNEIQELEKLTLDLEADKDQKVQTMSDNMIQKITQAGSLGDADAKRIIKLHKLRMDALEGRRRDERERMKARLQEKWKQKMRKLEEEEQNDQNEREAMLEQQESTVQQVLNSNLDLTDDAKERILREHERNMIALNNQLARSKLTQKMKLEEKMAQRKARLAELEAQQRAVDANTETVSEKEKQLLLDKIEEECALFEKERKEAENKLRKALAQETKEALEQQERNLALLIGRLEVGQARRQAVLQKQDQTLQKLQAQLEQTVSAGLLPNQMADQIIQQHYNQVEHINENMQHHRERQEQIINERIQAKRFKKQRELEEQLSKERQEMHYHRKQVGVGIATSILNQALMEKRQKKAMEELEREMQLELEKMKEQLNYELQQSLEKDLDQHKQGFLKQLAAAGNLSVNDVKDIERSASRNNSGQYAGTGPRMSRDLSSDLPRLSQDLSSRLSQDLGSQRPKSQLGTIEDDAISDDEGSLRNRRPATADMYNRERTQQKAPKKKKFMKSSPPQPRPAFQTSTGEQIHGTWNLEDDSDEL